MPTPHLSQPKAKSLGRAPLLSDLERLGELSDSWRGLDPTSIAESVLETLLDMLSLDFVGLRFSDSAHVFLRVKKEFGAIASADEIRNALPRGTLGEPFSEAVVVGATPVEVFRCPLGIGASLGEIIAGARRPGFPGSLDRAKLKLAAVQASLACRETRELSDRKTPPDTRDKPLSEQDLAESEWRLNLTINTIPTMAWSTTADGLIDFCNQNFVDFVGWTAEDISGQGFWPIFHPDDVEHLLSEWQDIMATKRPRDVEGRIRRADGEYRWFVLRQNPLLDDDGNVVKWYGAGADIEDRKRAERALKEAKAALLASERNLNLIINSLPVLVWSARPDGSADFINQSWRDYVGAPADKILEWGFLDLYHPDDVDGMMETWSRDVAHSDQTALKGRVRGADGQYRWFYFSGRKITDANGVVRWFGVNVDIEDLQRAEDALRASETALRESERALNLMLDAIPCMAWSATAEGHVDSVNKQFGDFVGMTAEEVLRAGFHTQFHPDDVDRMFVEWKAMMATKKGGDIEGRSLRADGEYRWLMCRCSPLLSTDGEIVRWYGVNLDIEDRKRAEAALQASEQNLSLILDSLPVLTWSARDDGSADFVNQRYLEYVGLPAEEILEFGFAKVLHPDDVGGLMSDWHEKQNGARVSLAQGRIRRFDGEYRWFYFSGQKFADANGAERWFGVNLDIEDLKRTEAALKASETALRSNELRLQHIINAVPGLVWSADADGTINFLSQQYLDYIGLDAEKARAGGWRDALHPEDAEGLLAAWDLAFTEGRANEHEARLRRSDGSYRWMLFQASPSFDDAGRLAGWFGVNIDIENRKRVVEDLRQSQNHLAHMTRMTAMGELAVSIAHEVNQPLMAIVTNAGACLRWLNGEEPDLTMARQAAERIVRDGHRAGDIITSLRNLARKSAPRMDSVRLEQVIQVVMALLQGELQRKGIVAKTQLEMGSETILGDVTQLQQVVLNLVMNAIEAMAALDDAPRRLTVRAQVRKDEALVSVSDTGPGLAADTDRPFEAFFSTKPEGIGMGLSICRSIIEAHGGKIWASNNGTRGGVFSFTLPLAERNSVGRLYN